MDLHVRYVTGLLPDPDAVLGFLRALEWDDSMRARQTASFGTPYDYSGRHHDPRPMPAELAAVAGAAAVHAGHGFDNCLANRYESGANTMGFHQDSYAGLVPGSAVAIVSLGATRVLAFRSLDRERRAEMPLAHNSLLLMTEETQRHWAHAIPRAPGAGLRFSLTFRLSAPRSGAPAGPPHREDDRPHHDHRTDQLQTGRVVGPAVQERGDPDQ